MKSGKKSFKTVLAPLGRALARAWGWIALLVRCIFCGISVRKGVLMGYHKKPYYCNITIPKGIKRVHRLNARWEVDLRVRMLTIPAEVEDFDVLAFANTEIGAITVDEASEHFCMRGDFLCSKDGTAVYRYIGRENIVKIPEGVTRVVGGAFAGLPGLASVTLPEGITMIESHTFSFSKSLSEVVLPEGLESIEENAFFHCDSLATITFPEGLESIGKEAFAHSGLTAAIFPESLTRIEGFAFHACAKLISVALPSGIKQIGAAAFRHCALKSVLVPHEAFTARALEVFDDSTELHLPKAAVKARD